MCYLMSDLPTQTFLLPLVSPTRTSLPEAARTCRQMTPSPGRAEASGVWSHLAQNFSSPAGLDETRRSRRPGADADLTARPQSRPRAQPARAARPHTAARPAPARAGRPRLPAPRPQPRSGRRTRGRPDSLPPTTPRGAGPADQRPLRGRRAPRGN
ncbi:PREDICTED: translation initiation factor IF-2-like, partial [Chinchilla lanigera]|uniref:translation initiation factor IF-2-like n=1 Tax=Chinchilla lanigera TaxID=34839 RepID=UPI000697FAEE